MCLHKLFLSVLTYGSIDLILLEEMNLSMGKKIERRKGLSNGVLSDLFEQLQKYWLCLFVWITKNNASSVNIKCGFIYISFFANRLALQSY